jgi:proline iminopeptidase
VATLERETVSVDGGVLEVFVGGASGPVLCDAPHPILPAVSAHGGTLGGLGRLVRVSPRHAGGSAPFRTREDAGLERLADDLEAVRHGLGLGPWVVYGYSGGGFAALQYAVRHPAGLAGLVLAATGPSLPRLMADPRCRLSARHPRWRAELEEATPRWAVGEAGAASAFRLERVREGLWVGLDGGSPAFVVPVPEVTATQAARFAAVRAFDVTAQLGAIRAPTLVLCGRDDDASPLAHSEALAAGIPGAELVVLERSGHAPMATEPEAFRAAVARFLGRL